MIMNNGKRNEENYFNTSKKIVKTNCLVLT